jgi:hypothetical protein
MSEFITSHSVTLRDASRHASSRRLISKVASITRRDNLPPANMALMYGKEKDADYEIGELEMLPSDEIFIATCRQCIPPRLLQLLHKAATKVSRHRNHSIIRPGRLLLVARTGRLICCCQCLSHEHSNKIPRARRKAGSRKRHT